MKLSMVYWGLSPLFFEGLAEGRGLTVGVVGCFLMIISRGRTFDFDLVWTSKSILLTVRLLFSRAVLMISVNLERSCLT